MICAETILTEREMSTPRGGRWLHVLSHTDPRYGGLSAAVPTLVQSLAQTSACRPAIAAFCLPNEQHRPAEIHELGDQALRFWPVSRKQWLLNADLKKAFAAEVAAADGLHIHGLWEASTAVAARTARRLHKPYVLSAHGMLEPWALAAKAWKKRLYAAAIEQANVAGAACLHALTVAEAEQYRSFGARSPIAVIPNAVSVPDDRGTELFFERFPALKGKRLVLFLSRLHPKKGVDLLVEAWKTVAPQFSDAHLVIAGPDHDGMELALRRQGALAGIDAHTTFTGMLAGPLKWSALESAALYVLPSHSEGLSMALLEAMAVGLPVLATYACNMPEITTSNAGWEVETTVRSLATGLHTALSASPEVASAMGRHGAELIRSRYSLPHVTRAMAEMYSFVLGGPLPSTLYQGPGGAP